MRYLVESTAYKRLANIGQSSFEYVLAFSVLSGIFFILGNLAKQVGLGALTSNAILGASHSLNSYGLGGLLDVFMF